MAGKVAPKPLKAVKSRVQASSPTLFTKLLNQGVLCAVDCTWGHWNIREVNLCGFAGGDVLLDFLNGTAGVFLRRSPDASAKDADHDIGIIEKLAIDDALRARPQLRSAVRFPLYRK